ncbi:hypothetical protein GIB67_009157 [Kingdonia uniflora]|uniref:Uncharacterized protein n=1 Tax=Kingdonia uniflora TaxID=39325 RepID=A0A7J7N2L6_9MAGN|nr:hypothetical protein GIB67_009157 [Kingdonia uniflora]
MGRCTGVAFKLLLRKLGPYHIIQLYGENAYELDIREARSNVVYVKLLTHFYGDIPSHLVTPTPNVEFTNEIDGILDSRLDAVGHVEFLIRWVGRMEEDFWISGESFARIDPTFTMIIYVVLNGKSCTTLRTEVSDGVYQTEDIPDINANNTLTVTLNQKENTEFAMSNLLNSGHPKCAVGDSSMDDAPSTENKTLDMVPAEEKAMISKESDISTTRRDFTNEVEMVDSEREPCNNRSTDVKVTGENDICTMVPSDQQGTPSTDHPLGLFNSSSQHLETVQDVIRSKGTNLLRPAIRVLLKKRDQLSQQQQHLEDEMARCENSLQTILSGGEENLLSIVERILEACDVTCSRGATETNLERHIRLDETHSPECMETKRLSEAILHLQNAYQARGFTANVVLVGTDFQYSAVGDLRVNPHKARESAATNILNKLRSMAASQAH